MFAKFRCCECHHLSAQYPHADCTHSTACPRTLQRRPTLRTKRAKAASGPRLPVNPSFVFPTRFTRSISGHSARASVNERSVSSVSVMADVLEIAALEPWLPPMAPMASTLNLRSGATIERRSALEIFVDVRTSFSSMRPVGRMGRLTRVKDRSSRSRLGQIARAGLSTVSLRAA